MFNPLATARSMPLLVLGMVILAPNSVVEACNTATQNTLIMELCPATGGLGCLTSVPPDAMKNAQIVATFTLNGAATSATLAWPEYSKTVCSDKSSGSTFTATDGGWDLNTLQTGSYGQYVHTLSYPAGDVHIWANYFPPAAGTTISIDGTPFNSTGTNIQAPMSRMQDYLGIYGGTYLAADMNNDGLTDIVHRWNPNGSLNVDVLINNGDGTFSRQHWLVNNGGDGSYNSYAVGDFNGDGWMDFVIIWPNNSNVAFGVYLNDQQGGFLAGQTWTTGSTYMGSGQKFLAGDFDGDGYWDIVRVGGHGDQNLWGQGFVDIFRSTGQSFSPVSNMADNIGLYNTTQQWVAAPFSGSNLGGVTMWGLAWISGDAGSTTIDVGASNGVSMSFSRWETSAYPFTGTYVPSPGLNAARISIAQILQSGSLTTYAGHRNLLSYFSPTYWQQNYGTWAGDGSVLSGTWWPGQKGLIRIVPGP